MLPSVPPKALMSGTHTAQGYTLSTESCNVCSGSAIFKHGLRWRLTGDAGVPETGVDQLALKSVM